MRPKPKASRVESVQRLRLTRRDLRQAEDVSDAVAQLPGARVLRVGGLGAPTQVLLRGGTPLQSQVTVEGIPLRSPAGRPLDLESLPALALRSIEVWRSRSPGALTTTPMAGVIRLNTDVSQRAFRAQLTSFGGGILDATAPWRGPIGRGGLALRWLNIRGDFPFLSSNGTPLDPSDDITTRRTNNRIQRASGVLKHTVTLGKRWRASAWALGSWRKQQLPGLAAKPAEQAAVHAHRYDVILRATPTSEVGGLWLRGSMERVDVDDSLGELGPIQQRRQWLLSAEMGGRWRRDQGLCRPRLSGTARTSWIRTTDQINGRDGLPATRWAVGGSAGVDCGRRRWRLSPTLRVQALQTARVEDLNWTGTWRTFNSSLRALPTAELSASLRLPAKLRAHASATWASRAPTMVELMGNDGAVRPAPRLTDERGGTLNVGVTGAWRGRSGRLSAAVEAYWGRRWDLIQLVRVAPSQAVHTNVGRVKLFGAEGQVRWAHPMGLELQSAYTLFWGRDDGDDPAYGGRALPLRPASQWAQTLRLNRPLGWRGLRWGSVVSWRWQAGNFTDRANLIRVPARERADLSFWLGARQWRVRIRVDNLTNSSQFDAVGFPLPGRRWTLGLTWRPEGA